MSQGKKSHASEKRSWTQADLPGDHALTAANPPPAHFDLGNVLDETGRLREAIQAYKRAIQLAPTYADYNLALAYEKLKQPRKALTHWRAYVRLDASGPRSIHARNQIRKTLASEALKLVYRRKK